MDNRINNFEALFASVFGGVVPSGSDTQRRDSRHYRTIPFLDADAGAGSERFINIFETLNTRDAAAREQAAREAEDRTELADWWDYVMSDDTVWHDKRRVGHLIAEMDTDYIRNTINWLKRHVEGLAMKCVSAEDREVMDVDHWLHHTPVMMALCDELLNR